MQLQDVRQIARGQYGLEYSTSEDLLYTNPLLDAQINAAYSWLVGVARPLYNADLTVSITVPGAGVRAVYTLDPKVIEPDLPTFWTFNAVGSVYKALAHRYYRSCMVSYAGPNEAVTAGTPTAYSLDGGNANAALKKVTLWPRPVAALTLHYGAWVYPAKLVNDTDVLEMEDADVYRLIPAVCWKMAEFDLSRGRGDAPAGVWADRAWKEAMEFQRLMRFGVREAPRGGEVGATPVQDAEERRRPLG